MLTESRKRQYSSGDESGHLVPQAKRQNPAHPLSPEPGRDAWDSECSNGSGSPGAPRSPLGSALSGGEAPAPYLHINRILKEAHFHSLHSRCQTRETQP